MFWDELLIWMNINRIINKCKVQIRNLKEIDIDHFNKAITFHNVDILMKI